MEQFRRMFQVAVHNNYRVSPGALKARRDCALLAEIATEAKPNDIISCVDKLANNAPGVIGGAVVDQDDFCRAGQVMEVVADRVEAAPKVRSLIEERDDHRYQLALMPAHSCLVSNVLGESVAGYPQLRRCHDEAAVRLMTRAVHSGRSCHEGTSIRAFLCSPSAGGDCGRSVVTI